MDELEQLHKILRDTAAEIILAGLATQEDFRQLDFLYQHHKITELDALKCEIARKMAQGMLDQTVKANVVDVLCFAHPSKPLIKQCELTGIYQNLYGLLAGIASRARDPLKKIVEELTNELTEVSDLSSLEDWVNDAVERKMFLRNGSQRLGHNPNIPLGKMLFEKFMEKRNQINQTR